VALNFALLPRYGLEGALIATGISTYLAVGVQLFVNKRFAMSCPWGTITAITLPLGLAFGLPVALPLLAIVGTACVLTNFLLDREEKAIILSFWQRLPFIRPLTISSHPPAEHAS
jgi:O-antigen/teichoic acid export membrane protein